MPENFSTTPQHKVRNRPVSSRGGAPGRLRCRGERGAALVELAFVLPLLFLLLFGIYEFGRGYSAKVELTGAVREGARAAALGQSAADAVAAAAPGLSPAPTVTVVTACPNPAPAGANAVVTATYPVSYSIPFFGTGTWTLQVTSVMRCGL